MSATRRRKVNQFYDFDSYLGTRNLTTIHLEGVEKALNDNPQGEPGGIKVHFRMDESGLLNVDYVSFVLLIERLFIELSLDGVSV